MQRGIGRLRSGGIWCPLLLGESSGLAIDFLINRLWVRDSSTAANNFYGLPTDKITTTRTTTAWYFDANGLLVSAGAGVARYDHDQATGAATGLRREGSAVNRVLWCRDLTNAAWVKTGITAAKDREGIDGVEASASSITATAPAGTCLQSITLASSSRKQSAYVKRLVGSGTLEMTTDNGSTWVSVAPTASWARLEIPAQTVTNPTLGFRIGTSGDSFAVDVVQNENGPIATSPILTTTAAVTRAPESHKITLTSLPWDGLQGTLYAEFRTDFAMTTGCSVGEVSDDTTDNRHIFSVSNTGSGVYQVRSASLLEANLTASRSGFDGADNRYAATWGTNYAQCALNGTLATADTLVNLPTVTTLEIGGGQSAVTINGVIKTLVYVPRTLSDDEISRATNFGWPGTTPAVNIAPNDAAIVDSDYVATLTKTSASVSGVRPFSASGYEYANPGWRRRFKTTAQWMVVHLHNLNLQPGASYNGRTLVSADGVIVREMDSAQSDNYVRQRIEFPDSRLREIELLMPHGASVEHLGLTLPSGYSISAPSDRSALPKAAFGGGSRVNGFNATSSNTTLTPRFSWSELLCRAKGWQQFNFGAAGRALTASDGTLVGATGCDVAFLQADVNDMLAQTPLATYKATLTSWIANYRAARPTQKLYVITSIWVSAAWDTQTIKIADYRAAAAEALTVIGDANNIIVDGLTLVTNSTASVPDGLHPNEAGSQEWATNLGAIASA